MMDEVTLILYSTEGCHLCEDAEALLRAARAEHSSVEWTVVDIADDDVLFEKYGWLIPVLQAKSHHSSKAPVDDDGALPELRWPFDGAALAGFLRDAGMIYEA